MQNFRCLLYVYWKFMHNTNRQGWYFRLCCSFKHALGYVNEWRGNTHAGKCCCWTCAGCAGTPAADSHCLHSYTTETPPYCCCSRSSVSWSYLPARRARYEWERWDTGGIELTKRLKKGHLKWKSVKEMTGSSVRPPSGRICSSPGPRL